MLVKKPLAKEALQRELGLTVNREIPVVGMITRLVEAKGLDLVMHIMDELMEEQVQLVVVGTGDEEYANALRELAWQHPGSVSVNILFNEGLARRVYAGADMFIMPYADALRELAWRHPGSVSVNILFNEGLARRVYAGSDMFIMPSRYEACGLSQMIAMRYGTVPVVRETGGLKDSVINFDKYITPEGKETGGLKDSVINFDKYNTPEGNGFSFANFNAHELLFTIKRGLTCFAEKPLWEKIVYNAMHSDNSWNRSAQAYADLYAKVVEDNTATVESVSEEQVEEATEEILAAVKGEETAEEPVNAVVAADTSEAEKAAQSADEEVIAEAAPAAEPAKKKTSAKRTTKKTADKTTETKKTAAKKTTAKKATSKKSAAATEEGTVAKKTSARKTTAKKKADTTAEVTTEAVEAAVSVYLPGESDF